MTTSEYYEANIDKFRNVIRTQHILVEDENLCRSLYGRILEGEDFAELAREYSICPSGKQSGGDLGFTPNGSFVPGYEEAAHALENIGDTTGPVKSQYGYHIIKLIDRRDTLPLDECEDIVQMLIDYPKN